MRQPGRLLVLGALAATVAGCGSDRTVGERLGVTRRAPDEFQVVRRAPLVLPPDYNLRPPQPGAAPAQTQDTAAQAEALLTGQPPIDRTAPAAGASSQSTAESALVAQSPVESEPGIREVLVAENQDLVDLDEGRFLFILSWQRRDPRRDEPVIDPRAEAERLAAGEAGGVVTQRTGSQPLLR
jgi:hypothetical protein